MADRWHPDLILLDRSLPQISGFWAARPLNGGPPPGEVWLLSPRDHPEYDREARAWGAWGCIPKTNFVEKIGAVLRNRYAGEAAGRLRSGCWSQANGSGLSTPAGAAERWVICRVDRQTFVLPIQQVTEVRKLPPFTTLPEAYAPLAGILPDNGRVVPLVDLKKKWNPAEPRREPSGWLVLLRSRSGLLGLIVDEMPEPITVAGSLVRPFPFLPGSGAPPQWDRIVLYKDRFLFCLDADTMLSDLSHRTPGMRER
jgi:purine-binding chemotaxis protein CheW